VKGERHIAMRTCLGCVQRAPQRELSRIALNADGQLAIDRARRAGGRGGYLHANESCWEQFSSRKGHVRSLARAIDKPTRLALVTALRRGVGA
jgi:uncharacterized protein